MHDPASRREASAVPLVLCGDRGHTVAGYLPAPEDLAVAAAAPRHRAGACVRGPHLRVVRTQHARNRSGVVGVYESTRAAATPGRGPTGPASRRALADRQTRDLQVREHAHVHAQAEAEDEGEDGRDVHADVARVSRVRGEARGTCS